MKNLNHLLKIILESGLDFIVIGGYAGAIHGSTLVTRDIDICMPLDLQNINQLKEILKELHPFHRMTPKKLSFLEYPETIDNIKNLYLSTDLGVIDILSDVIGVGDFTTVKSTSVEIPLYGYSCRVISIDNLIKTKKSMKRPKDIIAIEELEMINKK